ncbi:hypothetical protein V6N13_092353 [Hibiscus sabdariffa]
MESNKFALLFLAMAALLLAVAAPAVMAARNQVQPLSIIAVANANFKNPLANVFFDDTRNAANICIPNYYPCNADFLCCSGKCTAVIGFAGYCST